MALSSAIATGAAAASCMGVCFCVNGEQLFSKGTKPTFDVRQAGSVAGGCALPADTLHDVGRPRPGAVPAAAGLAVQHQPCIESAAAPSAVARRNAHPDLVLEPARAQLIGCRRCQAFKLPTGIILGMVFICSQRHKFIDAVCQAACCLERPSGRRLSCCTSVYVH
jgi:hypothetical protein